jgi:GT2 family glycosyltransferase
MQKKEIDLSIIIISLSTEKYHTKGNLEITLKSLSPALKNVNSEVIIVDNSTVDDGTLKMAREYVPDMVYLNRSEIHHFGANNNYGLKKAKGRYILFLNNDVKFLDDNILKEMIEWMDINSKIGASTCSLFNADGKTLQGSGGAFPNLFNVFAWMTFLDDVPLINKLIKSMHPMHSISPFGQNEEYYKKTQSQDWITGAFYLVRKEVLDKIGGFDENYDAYLEETDLSYRIKKHDWMIYYLPKWKIIHFGGQSYGGENSLIYELKNLKLFFKKHYPEWQLPILSFTIKLGCLLRIIVFSLFKPNLVKTYAKALKTV